VGDRRLCEGLEASGARRASQRGSVERGSRARGPWQCCLLGQPRKKENGPCPR
jgi:hypothetical protein